MISLSALTDMCTCCGMRVSHGVTCLQVSCASVSGRFSFHVHHRPRSTQVSTGPTEHSALLFRSLGSSSRPVASTFAVSIPFGCAMHRRHSLYPSRTVYRCYVPMPCHMMDVMSCQALAKGEVSFESKYGSIGPDDPCPLKNGLWSCQTEFNTM